MSAALQAPLPEIPPFTLFTVANERLKTEPLLTFSWPSEKHKTFARFVEQGLESLLRGANSSAKTRTGAAIVVACARGDESLCGVKLPRLQLPATIWVLTQSYKQQVDASQAAVLFYLGEHPHKITYVAGESRGYVENVWIATPLCKHGTGERCSTCSKIVFHCAESQSSIGGRIDMAWADEPPDGDTWREVRMRGRGDRRLYRFITATPIEKRWWEWMPGDFHQCEGKPREGRVEVRVTMDDNRFLTADVLADKKKAAKGDPRERSRLFGDYVDITGESPFPVDKLQLWLRRCRPPIRSEDLEIVAERRTPEGDLMVPVRCRVDFWHEFEDEETYIGVLDPAMFLRLDPVTGVVAHTWLREGSSSRGVPDPCGFHLYARRRPRLVARFVGYSGAYGLGSLAGKLARRYGGALLDTDLTGGPGEPTVKALTTSGYYKLNSYNPSTVQPGHGNSQLGFKITPAMRNAMVSSIIEALLSESLECASEAAVRSLMEVTYKMTPSGIERPEASYGAKDEDMICMGRFLMLNATLPMPRLKTLTGEDKLGRLLGRPVLGRPNPQRGKLLWTPR